MKRYSIEEKEKIMDLINHGAKVEDLAKKLDTPCKSTIKKWMKEYNENGGQFTEDNHNDAIPSWSGYNYQGKTAILCCLQRINKLLNQGQKINEQLEHIEKWKLQLEKIQDFAFLYDGEIKNLWQVKAVLSNKNVNGYYKALEKLLEDKKLCGNKQADCYLVSAIKIQDWEEKSNTYKDKVNLYKYQKKFVAIDKVSDYIKTEISLLLQTLDRSLENEVVYLSICEQMEQYVGDFHKNGKKDSYEIPFTVFLDVLDRTKEFEQRIAELRLKEMVYQNIARTVSEGTKIFCEDKCGDTCRNEACGVQKNLRLCQKNELMDYIRILKADVIEENLPDYWTANPDDYAYSICDIMKNTKAESIVETENIVFVSCEEGKIKAIPTMVDLKSRHDPVISRTLQRIAANSSVNEKIKDKILIANMWEGILETQSDKFTSVCLSELLKDDVIDNKRRVGIKSIMEKEDRQKGKIKFKKNVIILSSEVFIKYLKGIESYGKGNH